MARSPTGALGLALLVVLAVRELRQRKLNRFWSPDEICGWPRRTCPSSL